MAASTHLQPAADRNLLLGMLALQLQFLSRDALVAAMRAWRADETKSLGAILVEQGGLHADDLALLETLVRRQLRDHGADVSQSVAAICPDPALREDLRSILQPGPLPEAATPPAGDVHATCPMDGTPAPAGQPERTGMRFSVLRPHAEGGLGQVSIALDRELKREVALKEIKDRFADDPDSRARFLLEAEITGGLEHPGVVPVYGLGRYPDGRPYYAMRFVKGESLKDAIARFHQTHAAADPGARSLELRRLLGRFVDVCQTIAYAHSRGVLHRDIKPANILLGPYGETLIVDWGLAKSVGRSETGRSAAESTLRPVSSSGLAATQLGSAIGTPPYMSPEQAAGRPDLLGPASDVYSLGATLYALLTGKPPYDGREVPQILEQVQRGVFPLPRRVNSWVDPALEAICLKAMALKPEDRYASASDLGADVERWLADEPVRAYREPARTRLARWSRRHKALAGTAAAMLVATAAALAVVLVLVGQANRRTKIERDRAERSAATAAALNSFLINDLLAEAAPDKNPREDKVTVEEILDRSAQKVDRAFPGQPEVEAAVRFAIGTVYLKLALPDRAESHLRRALALRREHLGPEHRDTLAAVHYQAELLKSQERDAEAESLFRQNLEDRRRLLGPEDPDTLQSEGALGWFLLAEGKSGEAQSLLRRNLEACLRALGPENPTTLEAEDRLARLFRDQGQWPEAEAHFRQSMETHRRVQGPEHPDTLRTVHNLAEVLQKQGKGAEAEPLFLQNLDAMRRVYGPRHKLTVGERRNLTRLLIDLGKLADAERLARRELEDSLQLSGPEDSDTLMAEHHVARLLQAQGKLVEAESLLRRNLAIRRKISVPEHPLTQVTVNSLALVLRELGKWDEAEALFRDNFERRRRLRGRESLATLRVAHALALVLQGQGRLPEAEELLRENLEIARRNFGPGNTDAVAAAAGLAGVLRDRDNLKEAEPLAQEAFERRREILRPNHEDLAESAALLGLILTEKGRAREAEPLLQQALSVSQQLGPRGAGLLGQSQSQLGGCLTALARYPEAEPLLLAGYDGLERVPGATPRRRADALDRVIRLYEAWGKPEKAAEWRQKRGASRAPARTDASAKKSQER